MVETITRDTRTDRDIVLYQTLMYHQANYKCESDLRNNLVQPLSFYRQGNSPGFKDLSKAKELVVELGPKVFKPVSNTLD